MYNAQDKTLSMSKRKNVSKEEGASTTKKYGDDNEATITTYERGLNFLGSSSPIDDSAMESKAFSVLWTLRDSILNLKSLAIPASGSRCRSIS